MKQKFLTLILAALPLLATAQTETAPAFPGAEGFGRYTTGGRGGKVIHVTNLNDSGTGSLRAALSGTAKKIIVFDVGGYIDLKSNLPITSNTTILGQTAPSPGITLRYYTVEFTKGDNIICRFMRFRRSQVKDVNDGADATWGRQRKNIILDHCSFSWSIDEVASFYDNRDFTMQWCTIGEGLNSGHDKGDHSYGGIWGGKGASFHHNYITHVQNRAPRFNGARYNWTGYDKAKYANSIQAERVDFRNCVMYNWGTGGCYGGPGGGYINMVNNYYKAGPGTANKTRVTLVSKSDAGNGGNNPFPGYTSRYYIHGNYVASASKPENYDWNGVVYDSGLLEVGGEKYSNDPQHRYGEDQTYVKGSDGVDYIRIKLDSPVDAGEVTTHDAKVAYEKVLEYCGASLCRDDVDARYMNEARTGTVTFTGGHAGTKGILDAINNPAAAADPATASFPELASTSRPSDFDTDGDGMPDEWEIANGLNPNDANDALTTTLDSRGWYTNIEVYANSLVEHIMKGGNSDAVDGVEEYYPSLPSTGIGGITVGDSEIVETIYHNLQGQRTDAGAKGVKIKTVILKNNRRISTKVID
ncbi:MAG: pectate lyase [Bacteroidales bacterium]|nr:pectate lyase [Bacteroidales bacterium]MCM1146554.1 pectate lyase [Bacteroidales bacterium]MCM1205946.1 pectate lyase [Bacillota bacterium]MCM1510176.1 hypothetical protein [Clostridium sp.]